ncbi:MULTISPECIES: DUF1823 family protein [unclassified Picosynechococcus]|uniref:DUF1823 family protein n=1 Tax=unclassified Picosynechococcus TaxID=3079910 RepID=UPI0004AA5E4D|nr:MULTISPECIES: DUF1823 family protein [unclassified Picosynechococcus]AMA10454.1 hypothetical protein AWQ23_03550 [Picosynechococcus sp. PCC 73109]QCS50873.1 DUF1823 family protein [Picosynechococcus sp. PCC 11901]
MVTLPPLTTDTIQLIIDDRLEDETLHQLVWHYLGYRYDETQKCWNLDQVDPAWAEKYPEPPKFIEERPPTVQLTRSIPKPYKALLKEKMGFKGYTVDQLIPRLTRRATMASWLLSYMAQHDLLEV